MGKALVIEGLTVSNPITTVTFDVTVQSLTINKSSLSLTAGDTATLTATVTTSDGSSVTATFESSNTSVASVSSNGNTATITAVAAGSATITVRAGSKTQTCSVAIASSPTGDLATYYTNNATIANADKTALNALVTGMLNAGIWAKVKRFYPILGTTKHDLVLEVKDNSSRGFDETSALIANQLDASTNVLSNNGTSADNLGGYGTEPMAIKTNNFAIVCACTVPSDDTNGKVMIEVRTLGASSTMKAYAQSSYRMLLLYTGNASAGFPSNRDIENVLERNIIMSANSSAIDFYLNGSKLSSESVSNSAENLFRTPISIFGGNGVTHKFMMITEALTESEALALSTLVETFLVATGKKSAS